MKRLRSIVLAVFALLMHICATPAAFATPPDGSTGIKLEFFKKVVDSQPRFTLFRAYMSDVAAGNFMEGDVEPTGCEITLSGQTGGGEYAEWAVQGMSFFNPVTGRFYLHTMQTGDRKISLHVIRIERVVGPLGPVTQCQLEKSVWNLGNSDDGYTDDIFLAHNGNVERSTVVGLVDEEYRLLVGGGCRAANPVLLP